jgi:hypothetical protein
MKSFCLMSRFRIVLFWPTVAGACLAAALLVAASDPARANLVVNGGFEQTTLTTTGYVCDQNGAAACTSEVTGWNSTCAVYGCVNDGHDVLFDVFPNNITGYNSGTGLAGNVTASPAGGNFIAGDGDPTFSAPLFQTISGLTAGDKYLLTFYQAAAQQGSGLHPTATTEQWQVSLGSETQASSLMSTPAGSWVPWQTQTMTFTATAASEVLSFLALGGPVGEPPVSLLDGVSLTAAPEPASLALFAVGVAATIGAVRLRRRKAGC